MKTTSQRKLAALERGREKGRVAVNSDDKLPSHSDLDDGRPAAHSMSVKERMSLYKKDLETVDERAKARSDFHKRQRGLEDIHVTTSKKSVIADAFSKRIVKAKAGTLAGGVSAGGVGADESGTVGGLSSIVLARDRRRSRTGGLKGTTEARPTTTGIRRKKRLRKRKGIYTVYCSLFMCVCVCVCVRAF